MTTITVGTTAALSTALKNAAAGDIIQLAPGTYSALSISNLHFATDVTVTSQYASNQAVLTGLTLTGSNGLTFSNLDFKVTVGPSASAPFQLGSSQDITFTGLNVHGSLDGDPSNDGSGMLIRSSSNVTIENSEFQQLKNAIGHLNDSYLNINHNDFHDLRSDGIQGGGSSNVEIFRNHFSDFYPGSTTHADAIQFWTTNTTTSAHDIDIRENVMMRGAGLSNFQGVFAGDEVGTLPYKNLTIADNLVVGGGYNGIAVKSVSALSITGNTVSGYTDNQSWIRYDKVTSGTIGGNAANSYVVGTAVSANVSGNSTIAQVTDGGAALYKAWLLAHPDDGSASAPPSSPSAPAPSDPLTGGAGGDTLTGTTGNDVMTGASGADNLSGLGGTDSLSGGDGNDTLLGGDGADRLDGGAGIDVMTGGAGNDTYIVTSGDSVVESTSGSAGGVDLVYSYSDFTLGANVENLRFGGSSSLHGVGNGLGNVMTGNGGGDWFQGLGGNDTLNGATGVDTLAGGTGNDLLVGGAGADRFVFAKGDGDDTIRDFGLNGEHDVLDISSLLNAGLKPTLTQSTAGVTLSFTNGDSVLLEGAHLSSLHSTSVGYIF